MHIGIDIGGSKINSIVLSQNKKIIVKKKVEVRSMKNRKTMIFQIFDCIEYLLNSVDRKKVKGVGIGFPGPTNVTALKNLDLVKEIQRRFPVQGWSTGLAGRQASGGKIKIKIDNDANCFGLAEAILGAGKNNKIVAGLTLGTGVGGALIINKNIFHGANNKAAEFGHMTIQKDGRKCTCGNRGCLEAYISAKGLLKTSQEIGLNISDPRDVGRLARKNNKKAIKVFHLTGEYLGIGLVNLIKILNPGIIVIGGGITENAKFIFKSAQKIVDKRVSPFLAKNTKIVRSKLGEDAGAIGAALLFTVYPQ